MSWSDAIAGAVVLVPILYLLANGLLEAAGWRDPKAPESTDDDYRPDAW